MYRVNVTTNLEYVHVGHLNCYHLIAHYISFQGKLSKRIDSQHGFRLVFFSHLPQSGLFTSSQVPVPSAVSSLSSSTSLVAFPLASSASSTNQPPVTTAQVCEFSTKLSHYTMSDQNCCFHSNCHLPTNPHPITLSFSLPLH